LLASLSGFSQKLILSEGDTLIGFSLRKSRYLLNQTYRVKELDTLLKVAQAQLANEKRIILNDSLNMVDCGKQRRNDQELLYMQKVEIGGLKKEVKAEHRKCRWQVVQKWTAVGVAIAVTGFSIKERLTDK
jgi:hypothetical protein